ncbi:uncharacterized protein LOC121405052 [Drosophila obscura]|uniref:uncharacterized protein LOC121405052 n=1 Tax=Drosophila obscura TaxID=7282 RepID=UPI001BB0FEC3|nr:uncharacterized protein LOC121405052 [Drosophila obscura]
MSADARSSCIKKKQLCLNCFARGHLLRDCSSSHNCSTCGARHHTLLHRAAPSSRVAASTSGQAPSSSEPLPNVQSYFAYSTSTVLLGTALINICHLGTNFRSHALIDSGSEATFITERLFNIIKPPFEAIQAQVAGLNQTVAAKAQRRCHFMIGAASRPGLKIETMAYFLPQLAGNLPSYPIPQHFLDKLPNLPLADPSFHRSSQILGADIFPSILLSGFRSDICGSLLGKRPSSDGSYPVRRWRTFWGDLRCPENVDLGHSRCAAQAQFLKNEQSLQRNLPLKEQYDAVIQEYLELGHMTAVTPSHDSGHYYLPHHAVFKPDNTTTKLRVVFNASSPSSNGKSLNDTLHSGPVLQSDLTMQILRWRVFRYVFNADISKMYRQIQVSPNTRPISEYSFATQLAQEVRPQLPMASDILESYMYVDDVLAGAHTQSQAISAISELRKALDSAGFPLRKWTANHKGVLRDIPVDHLLRADFLELEESSIAKTLGIRWQASADEFFFAPPEVLHRESSKTRVAPVKTVSLPRLELCGAVLLTELSKAILPQLPLDTSQVSFWTDSTIVLAWLNRPACDWTTFMGNRVAKITRCWPSERWSTVRSEDNPADLASRGLGPTDLVGSDMWWHGPAWLHGPKSEWPCPRDSLLETDLEKRAVKVDHATSSASDILSRFSELGRQTTHVSEELNGKEVAAAHQAVTLTTQRFHYAGTESCGHVAESKPRRPCPTTNGIQSCCHPHVSWFTCWFDSPIIYRYMVGTSWSSALSGQHTGSLDYVTW